MAAGAFGGKWYNAAEWTRQRAAAMDRMAGSRSAISWGIVDGSVSISLSMLLNGCVSCSGWWGLGWLQELAGGEAGVLILATLLLFPTALAAFGGPKMFFLAKQQYEERRERLRQQEQAEIKEKGRQQARDRIRRILQRQGIEPSAEIVRLLSGESSPEAQLEEQGRIEEYERLSRALEQYGIRFAPEQAAGQPYLPTAVSEAAEQGQEQGRKAERDRIFGAVEELGVQLPPEIARIISGESERESQIRREERERIRQLLAQSGSLSEDEIASILTD